ncbi:hypothetical protein JHK82_056014 [Glycine max]|nr:hypothetical protein JHK82_056014 [Glycine max]
MKSVDNNIFVFFNNLLPYANNSSKGVRSNPLSDFGILKNFSVDIHPRKAKIIKQPRLVVLHAKRRLMSLFWRVRAYMKRQIKARSNNNTTFNYDPFSYSLNFDDGNFRFFILPNIATIYLAPQRYSFYELVHRESLLFEEFAGVTAQNLDMLECMVLRSHLYD